MALSELQRAVLETNAQRDRAEAVLESLTAAKTQIEAQLATVNRTDALEQVKGKSAIDDAIASTRRMIDTLNRALTTLRERAAAAPVDAGLNGADASHHAHRATTNGHHRPEVVVLGHAGAGREVSPA